MIITTEAFIIVVCVALCCAAVYSYFYKNIYCVFVKKLIDKNIVGEENEILLSQLEISDFSAFFIKKALSSQTSVLARVISSKDDGKGHILVYLLPEKVEEAQDRFKGNKTSAVSVIVSVILCIIVAIFAIFIYPTIEEIVYNAKNDYNTEEKDDNYSKNEENPVLPEISDEIPESENITEENPEKLEQNPDDLLENDESEDKESTIPKIPEVESRFE